MIRIDVDKKKDETYSHEHKERRRYKSRERERLLFIWASNRKDFGPFASRKARWGKDSGADGGTEAGRRMRRIPCARKASWSSFCRRPPRSCRRCRSGRTDTRRPCKAATFGPAESARWATIGKRTQSA